MQDFKLQYDIEKRVYGFFTEKRKKIFVRNKKEKKEREK